MYEVSPEQVEYQKGPIIDTIESTINYFGEKDKAKRYLKVT
jgi:hypothetical protein